MVAAATGSAWIGALVALPFCSTLRITGVQTGQLALFGVTSFGLGLILYSVGARHLPAARSALITALDTPLAPLWVWLAFGERPAVASAVGGAIVLAAVIVNILRERAPEPVAARELLVEPSI
jgi:drug/metabolite transporter (DMT)-like permease